MTTSRRQILSSAEIVSGAVGPFDDYCDGYGNPGASGLEYISVLKLSTGMVAKTMDQGLEGIVSYGRAEKNDAYAGQINMITASSFNGLNGAIWGYDVARHDGLTDGSIQPIMRRTRHDGVEIPIYPTTVWSAIALSIAEHRDRDSSLFIEDVGHDDAGATEAETANTLHARLEHIVDASSCAAKTKTSTTKRSSSATRCSGSPRATSAAPLPARPTSCSLEKPPATHPNNS
jgi:hypothetical protein